MKSSNCGLKTKATPWTTQHVELKLNPPQNFAQYRQTEMDQSRVSTFVQVAELPYMSKRFALKRFLGLSEEEMAS
jgi:hypothetical protein